ncbi:hypothetical protein ACQPZ8_29490 [Actinomadura nitritigenes]|uniref:hypothetical protein n=1 Tax=Actinomadura nitritigenes TaxID=134602 RepID=UPI003D8F98EA
MIRLLRLELRRNVVPLLLPVLTVLVWVSPYGRSLAEPAVWPRRAEVLQETLLGVGPVMAGAGAWTASREHRARMRDLLASTARGAWARTLPGWAATALWGLAFLAAATGVLYGLTGRAATWGGPPWWPVAAAAAMLSAFCAGGFTAGALLPGRFVAPLTAIGAFVLLVAAASLESAGHAVALVSPVGAVTDPYRPLFFRTGSAVPEVQVAFAAGLIALAIGALAFPAAAAGRVARSAGAVLAAVGTGTAGTALWLAGTGHIAEDSGTVTLPRLESADVGRPIAYTPVCGGRGIQVCVHPAFKTRLDESVAALRPVTGQLAGIAGVPSRIDERILPKGPELAPTVLYTPAPLGAYSGRRIDDQAAREMRADAASGLLLGGWDGTGAARQAVVLGVLSAAGDPIDAAIPPLREEPDAAVTAAARRFAALAPAARQRWLAAHLTALRAGRLTLMDLP